MKVKYNVPNIEGRGGTELLYEYLSKTYQIISEDKVDGKPVYTIKMSIDDSDEFYIFHLDKDRRFLVDYTIFKRSAIIQSGVNEIAPCDSLVDGVPTSVRTMLDFVVFPTPKANEDREVVAPRVRRIDGYCQ